MLNKEKTITISLDEYNQLLENQKQVDELTKENNRLDKNVKWFQEKIENGELVSEQAVKDTAKEIFSALYHREEMSFAVIKFFAKEYYGVEVE